MNLIYQYFDGPLPKWAKISSDMFQNYAKKNGSDYTCETSLSFSPQSPYFEYLKLIFDKKYDKYDQILYCDMDVIPEKMDNIFDEQISDIGMVAERQYSNMTTKVGFTTSGNQKEYGKCLSQFGLKGIKENGKYILFNSGVVLLSQKGRQKARKEFSLGWQKWFGSIKHKQMKLDQPYLNSQLEKIDLTELPLKWNCFPRERWENGYFPKDAVFVHYTNKKKKTIEELYV